MRYVWLKSLAVSSGLFVTASVFGSCTLTGPLDGYAGGELPDASAASDGFTPCTTPGYADCDKNPQNGCETPVENDINNCGVCGRVCTALDAGGTPSCTKGMCSAGNCPGGYADCDNNGANGCETDIATQVDHCGSCTNKCNLAQATQKCQSGLCKVVECNANYANCDNQEENGCEVDTRQSVQHCGKCGQTCAAGTNASPLCSNGTCTLSCTTGFGDCDSKPETGCETPLSSDVAHCGNCSLACSAVGGTAACVAGKCQIACTSKNADCNKDVADGCETDLGTDPKNCGICGQGCQAPSLATPLCVDGVCDWKCNLNLGDCNGLTTDGCETNLGNDTKNCGACKHDCLGASCLAAKCQSLAIASSLARPTGILVESNSVFWTDISGDGTLLTAPVSGGAPTVLANYGAAGPLATDGTNIYWPTGANIAKVSLAGGVTSVLVAAQIDVSAIAADKDFVYWAKSGTWTGGVYNKDGAIVRVPGAGGATQTLISGQILPAALAVDSSYVYWTNQGTGNDGAILKMPKSGGAAITLAQQQSTPCGIALNATAVFWVSNCLWSASNPGAQTLRQVPKTGGVTTALASSQNISASLAAEDTFVYWAFAGFEALSATGTISKISVVGGDPVVLADSQNHPHSVALDSQRVYWTNSGTDSQPPLGDGSVRRVAK